MSDNYNRHNNPDRMVPEQLENMYPEVYNDIYPLAIQAVDDMVRRGYTPTAEMINAIVDNIIKMSGMWDEDDDIDQGQAAIPAQMGFGGRQFRRFRRGHHNRNTLRDIIRILLLRELFDRRGGFHR